jgi:hypothetical protein
MYYPPTHNENYNIYSSQLKELNYRQILADFLKTSGGCIRTVQ